jgi:hypothetical protein
MLSTPRVRRRGRRPGSTGPLRLAAFAAVIAVLSMLAATAVADPKQPLPPNFPEQPTTTPNWPPPNWPPPHGETATPDPTPAAETPAPTANSGGTGQVAAATASGRSDPVSHSRPPQHAATVADSAKSSPPPVKHHPKKHVHAVHAIPLPTLVPPPLPAPVASGNPSRSNFADHLLSPTQIDLSAKNLGEGGLIALLLAALLYLPVTIFNKATEKNHDTISRWFARPRAWVAGLFGWIPVSKHPGWTLTGGVIASAALFAFIEPGFPSEQGALEYLLGMMIGFALVSVVFFASWKLVLQRLEPDSEGHWRIYPPYILLAAFLVVMARLAHFIPGVVLGTVAEYHPAKRLCTRTAGIRVMVTYGALILLGLAAWFAWVPIEHAAAKEGAGSLTLILDSALSVTFVSALESVAFGLIPMTFLDGNDLYRWHKGIWAAMWGSALAWFSIVIAHPALSTYQHEAHGGAAVWFVLLFSTLMLVSLATWGFFRVREVRQARASAAAS